MRQNEGANEIRTRETLSARRLKLSYETKFKFQGPRSQNLPPLTKCLDPVTSDGAPRLVGGELGAVGWRGETSRLGPWAQTKIPSE